MAVLDDVKVLLDIEGTDLDNKLNLIIRNAERQVLSYLPSGTGEVPEGLLPGLTGWEMKECQAIRRKVKVLLMGMIFPHISPLLKLGTVCRRKIQKEGCGFYEVRDTGHFCERE